MRNVNESLSNAVDREQERARAELAAERAIEHALQRDRLIESHLERKANAGGVQ